MLYVRSLRIDAPGIDSRRCQVGFYSLDGKPDSSAASSSSSSTLLACLGREDGTDAPALVVGADSN